MALTDKVRIVTVPAGTGGTLTSASITGLTPTILGAYNLVEHNKAKVIAMAKEARDIGVIGKPWRDLLMSRITEIDKASLRTSALPGNQSVILPYVYRTRKSRIGNHQFTIASGAVNANAGSTVDGIVYPDSARNIVVNVGPGRVSTVPDLHLFFLKETFIYVEGINVSTSAKTVTPLRVVTASTTGGVTTVVVAANRTDTWWGAASSDEKAPYQPTHGTVFLGNNNVKDYQSYSEVETARMSKSLVVSWLQTSRYVQITDTVYEETLKNVMAGGVNDVAKSFSYLSIADQNKIMADQHEAKWYNDILYGEILDERQTDPSNYDTLTPELDVLDNQTVYGYVTRAEGIRTLLAKESQVIDFAGGSFDLDVLFPRLYEVYRNRKETGDNVECIDLLTDKDSAAMLRSAFRAIQKAFYGVTDTTMYTPGKVLEGVRTQFTYERYCLPGVPYDIAVFVLENLTDRIASFGDGTGGVNGAVNLKNSARIVLALDWSDIEIPISATASARRELNGTNAANVLASLGYVIKLNPKKIDLRSVTHSVFIGDESRHVIFENYALAAPLYTLPGYAAPVYS